MDYKVFVITTCMLVVYLVLGGLLFQYLERRPHDDDSHPTPDIVVIQPIADDALFFGNKIKIEQFVRNLLQQAISVDGWSLNLTIQDSNNRTLNETELFTDGHSYSIDSELSLRVEVFFNQEDDKWDIYASIFFAAILITTVGYGNIGPVTVAGRLVSSLYVVIGLPILGMWGAAIGENLVHLAARLRKKIKVQKRYHREFLIAQATLIIIVGSALFIFLPSLLFSRMEGWPYSDGIYFCIMTLGTVGLGDLVATFGPYSPDWYRFIFMVWLFFGLGWLSTIVSFSIKIFTTKAKKVIKVAEEKVAQIKTEIKQKLIASRIKPVRRRSFSGKRQVSVMLSKTSTAVHIVDLKTGVSRLVSTMQDATAAENEQIISAFRKLPFVRTSSVILVQSNDELHRTSPAASPRSMSPRSSLTPADYVGHHVHPMPTITEVESATTPLENVVRQRKNQGQRAGPPEWIIGDELVVETSKRRPTLGIMHGASVLLFDKSQMEDTGNDTILEELSHQAMLNSASGPEIKVIAPNEDEEEQMLVVRSPARYSQRPSLSRAPSSQHVTPPASPRSMRKNDQSGSHLQLPKMAEFQTGEEQSSPPVSPLKPQPPSRLNSIFDHGAATLVTPRNAAQNLVVVTDNGIAESLDSQITVLRPRSKSLERQ